MCRSGQRTLDAGQALEAAGFTDVSHVVHGFEGDLDARFQRSSVNGWRHEGLPWEQM
jgi:rhodanese-related sulfurtransferase